MLPTHSELYEEQNSEPYHQATCRRRPLMTTASFSSGLLVCNDTGIWNGVEVPDCKQRWDECRDITWGHTTGWTQCYLQKREFDPTKTLWVRRGIYQPEEEWKRISRAKQIHRKQVWLGDRNSQSEDPTWQTKFEKPSPQKKRTFATLSSRVGEE